ncbi:ankyrin repeat-containing protein BDA1-like [Corylus avellana]|uniref:ankyrin repeat-containing protein BDA1-like n=1 Tax=Corylus avellana TaxID=13451 RepID=UPI00286B0907|nr:ankyrin repeat-containing protein BDA1-like [Corylus avellana]
MDQNLRDASEQGNVDGLYSSIARDPKVLDKIDEIPFVDTPLHVAAAAGQTEFAMEMTMLKPSFAKKLNPNGFTPLLLAMHNYVTSRKETALHVALKNDELDAFQVLVGLGRMLLNVQDLNDVTSRKETALHVALKNDELDAFQVLVGLGRRLLNVQDLNGNVQCNTVLHIAASKNQPQRMLMSNDMRNMLVVVAVLLVTIAYQTVLSPPGGFWQDNQFNTITNASSEVNQPPHRAGQ